MEPHYMISVEYPGTPGRNTVTPDADTAYGLYAVAADLLKPGEVMTLKDASGEIIRQTLNTSDVF